MNQPVRIAFSILCTSVACFATTAFAQTKDADFTSLFDGKTSTGWEHSGNWVIEGGAFYRKEKGGSLTYTASTVKNDQGNYIHEAVWRYLFTHPVDQTGEPVPLDPDCRIDQEK